VIGGKVAVAHSSADSYSSVGKQFDAVVGEVCDIDEQVGLRDS